MPGPIIGGVEVATLRIADVLPKERYQSVFFCLSAATQAAEYFRHAGYPIVEYEKGVLGLRNPLPFWRISKNLAESLRRERIDIVHCADYLSGEYALLGAALARCRIICHIRNRFARIPLRDRLMFQFVDQFAFVSQESWRSFGARVSAARGRVVYDGLDIPEIDVATAQREVRNEFGISSGRKIIGMSARIAEQKDHETLVRAAPRILCAHPEIHFLMVGDHSSNPTYRAQFARIQRIIAEVGVGEAFTFTDFRRDALRLTAAMDIFILSTHAEGLPLVLLEAMLLNRPCVATAADGIPELITHGQSGLLVPPRDPKALAEAVIALLDDPAYASRLAAAGRLYAEKRFSRGQFRNSLEEMYTGVLQ